MLKLSLTQTGTNREGHPPLALGYIASYLRKYLNFNNIVILDKEPNTINSIIKEKPDILGISSSTVFFNQAIKIAKNIKESLDIPIIIGGPHITALPHTLDENFDIAVVGEGEETTFELIQLYQDHNEFEAKKLKNVKGITFRDNEKVIINERRELIKPLDKIPYPARDLFKMEEEYLVPRMTFSTTKLVKSTHMLTSRGCPYKCVFCASSCFWQIARFHSPEYVVGEIKYLIKKYKLKNVNIFDDLFIADKERFRKIVEMLESEEITEKCKFRILGRANLINDETADLIKRMNIDNMAIGFESQSPKVLKYLKKGTTTVEQNQNAVNILHKKSIDLQGLFMIGSPHETKEDMMMTLDFIRNNKFDTLEITITTPLPGTELWEYAKKKNLVNDYMDWDQLHMHPIENGLGNILLDEEVTKEEFAEIFKLFTNEIETRQLKINISNLFSWKLIKLALRNRDVTLEILKNKLKSIIGRKK
jgi:radical SAM superfamily enzyme YgiQ (UPF0313 family)